MALPSLTLVASGLLIAAFVLVVAAGLDLTWLRATTPVLRGRRDLNRFRRAVNRQRYALPGRVGSPHQRGGGSPDRAARRVVPVGRSPG